VPEKRTSLLWRNRTFALWVYSGHAGSRLTVTTEPTGKARPDRLALKRYWGKPAVRDFREGDGDVGIIRSPVRAIALPDLPSGIDTLTAMTLVAELQPVVP